MSYSIPGAGGVSSVNGKTGAVALVPSDLGAAPLASPALTGTPTAPTPATGDASTLIATTAHVNAKIAAQAPGLAPVQSVNGRTGTVTLAVGDVSGAVNKAGDQMSGDLSVIKATARFKASTVGFETSAAWHEAGDPTNGIVYFGREDSAGSSFGATPYAGVICVTGSKSFQVIVNGSVRHTIDSNGNHTIPGPLILTRGTTTFRTTDFQMKLVRSNPNINSQLISFGVGIATDCLVGRQANSDDLVFGFDNGASFMQTVKFPTGGGINLGQSDFKNYQEGTWTPTLPFRWTNTGTPYLAGYYRRIGNWVRCVAIVGGSSSGGTGTVSFADGATVGGLPFTPATIANGGFSSGNVANQNGGGLAASVYVSDSTAYLAGSGGTANAYAYCIMFDFFI